MAKSDFSKRKKFKVLSFRTIIFGVPSLWILVIWWTMYNTQSIQQLQSLQRMTSPFVGENHLESSQNRVKVGPESKSKQTNVTGPDLLGLHGAVQKTLKPPDQIAYDTKHEVPVPAPVAADDDSHRNDAVDETDADKEETGNSDVDTRNEQLASSVLKDKPSKFLQLLGAENALDLKNRLPTEKFVQPRSSVADITTNDNVEVFWDPAKPKPPKKIIVPGPRFDPPKLGEYGIPVMIEPEHLDSIERRKYDEGWQKFQFNEYASSQISTQRETPEYRPWGCKVTQPISHLPQASIIICFYNEAWSVLLRTIHSVLTRSPPELITEIILVDDYSDMVMMREPLEYYVAQVDKLRLVRMNQRSGLVRARLAGVQKAKGPVLVFLDSHVECEEGWLLPLLQAIYENPKVAITPEIDVIDHKDFSIHSAYKSVGILRFRDFTFDWTMGLPRIEKTRKSNADPVRCKVTQPISHLPQASIIICFYNEAWSVLLRTIHSVLTRSPPELITEIILVDDYSDMVMMREPLEYYVAQVDKLRLVRMNQRSGLVRARLAGVQKAKGPVLVFLDSHVECEEGWLLPLLQAIYENPKVAITPEIDVIDHKDFSIHSAYKSVGILRFRDFTFDWTMGLPRIEKTRKSNADPVRSPTMAGGLFAIRKDYFVKLGTYDTGLELWGGENIELSLKLWMCGGEILIHPCSRVAHIFRDKSPYLTGKSATVLIKNSARVAQVWADEYRDIFFEPYPYNEKVFGSVQERIDLRKKLQCQTFSWYIDKVYPEMYIEGTGRYIGQIRSVTGLCIHKPDAASSSLLTLTVCDDASQWESTRIREIRHSSFCMDRNSATPQLVSKSCDLKSETQVFEYQKTGAIFHPFTNTCLTASYNWTYITFQPCRGRNLQIWKWAENKRYIPPPK